VITINDPYSSTPLNIRKREIRLMKLEHSLVSEPLKCSLHSYTIDGKRPEYIALSYCWGPKTKHNDIQLNGVTHAVGRSLWAFLHQIRAQQHHITFWIDALCINQSESKIHERNHQVEMMRDIYSSVRSVWV